MAVNLIFMILLVMIPLVLLLVEYFLVKRKSVAALILPVVVACFGIVIGVYPLIVAAIMFLIYFVYNKVEKMKQQNNNEIEKMNIQDL